MPFGGLTYVGLRQQMLDGVRVGGIHSSPRGVTRQRYGLLSLTTCCYFFIFLCISELAEARVFKFCTEVGRSLGVTKCPK